MKPKKNIFGISKSQLKKEKAKDIKGTTQRFLKYLKPYYKSLIIVFITLTLGTLAGIIAPIFITVAVDNYIVNLNLNGLFKIVAIMGGLYLLDAALIWIANYLMVNVSQKAICKFRNDLMEKLETLSLSFFDKNPKGDIMSRVTNDTNNISNALSQTITQLIDGVITVVGIFIIMTLMNWLLALTVFITVPILFIIIKKISGKIMKYFKLQQEHLGNLNSFAEESITGIRTIKAYTNEEILLKEFKIQNDNLRDTMIKAQTFGGIVHPINEIISNLGFALLVGVGAMLVLKGNATIGIIATFVTYANQFKRPLQSLTSLFSVISSAIAGAERIFYIMDQKPTVIDKEGALKLNDLEGDVEFHNVDFSYDQENNIFENLNLKVNKGETIAIVGPTGAGKTTIINMLARFYDINKGVLLIDNKDIKELDRTTLRENIGIVLQDTYLFQGTILENIKYGKLDATQEEIENAAKMAHADDFIKLLPKGYEEVLSEEASNISEGQKQLLSIARTILANPDILVLDEATSNVDTRTEFALQKALKYLTKNRTSFVIAHRLSTIREADRILVINHGQIIEDGNHQDLLKKKGFYYNLYTSQFE